MVFRGRPSKACSRCRLRRLKCDLQPGSCGSCLRANEHCHGYRADTELRIHDETDFINRKLRMPLPKPLQYAIELQARSIFFAHYVLPGSRGWDFLIQIPNSAPAYLTSSIDAVCLAFLAHRRMSSSLFSRARLEYSTALRTMNKALPSSDISAKHYMLTSSMCLDLFEKIINTGSGGNGFWLGHINGSLALVQALGLKNLSDPMSLRLLVRLVTNCTISSVASATAIPQALLEIRSHVEKHSAIRTDPKWKLTCLMAEYAFLRSQVAESKLSFDDHDSMACDLDLKLVELSRSMPDGWLPGIQGPTDAFPRKEIYANRHVTQAWNTIRLVRVLIHDFLLQCRKSDYEQKLIVWDNLQNASVNTIRTMSDDICATISQYADSSFRQNMVFGINEDSSQIISCYTLFFPLYVVGRSKWTAEYQRSWALEQLQRIGQTQNIPKAFELIHLIKESPETDPWHVYAQLGSYGFAA